MQAAIAQREAPAASALVAKVHLYGADKELHYTVSQKNM